jgi:hypothetical protein
VVNFCGHSHSPLTDPRSIWQGDYTSLNTGSLAYLGVPIVGHPDYNTAGVTATNNRGSWEKTGSEGNTRTGGMYYIIELDRKGSKDAVFYECNNPEFEKFITENGDWATAPGIFTDICTLAPALKCAAVNFSCGYYNAHTTKEYVVLPEMEANIVKVCDLIERTTEDDKFEFIQAKSRWIGGWGNVLSPYEDYADDDDNGFYNDDLYGDMPMGLYGIRYINEHGIDEYDEVYARSELEAAGVFLSEHTNMTFAEIEIDFYGVDDYYM